MLPGFLTLVLIAISSAFQLKAQDQGKSIPANFAAFTSTSSAAKTAAVTRKDTIPCYCSSSPQITQLTGTNTNRSYQGNPNAICYPIQTRPGPLPGLSNHQNIFDSCGVSSIAYSWSITAGNNIAAINGSSTSPTVNVLLSSSGTYTLQLQVTVTCSNGATCTSSTSISETVTVETRSCSCQAAPVNISATNKQGTTWSYSGTAPGTCTGQYGTEPNLQNCGVQNVIYEWSITGNGVASLSGPTNQSTVNVTITGNGSFELRLQITTVCSDGRQCINYNTFTDTATLPSQKNCSCNVDVDCSKGADQNGLRTYNGILKGGCTGEYGPSPPYLPCTIKNVVWSWTVTEGNNVVEIAGPANQQTVNVSIKGTGKYTLRVQADVECSDGTKSCGSFNFDYCMDSVSSGKKCNINVEEKVEPLMNGGLQPRYVATKKIERDAFIVLGADGKDYDQVKFTCIPSDSCRETGGSKTVALNSRIEFVWIIMDGEGSFVDLGHLPEDRQNDEGDHVIFKPPFVPLPQAGNESSKTTIVHLLVIDNNPTQPVDPTVTKVITITTKRSKNSPDEYTVVVQGPTFTTLPIPVATPQPGACDVVVSPWEQKTDLKTPEVELPGVADKDKMVVGEWIVLRAKDQRDHDKLKVLCQSATCENAGPFEKLYEDNVTWEWKLEGGGALGNNGKFVSDPKGRFVIYEAPEKLQPNKDVAEVKIKVTVKNPDGLKIKDDEKNGEIVLKIFRAGVRLEFPPLDWLPEENNEVPIRSFLVYRENGTWRPALAHQARIHFFELLDVSKEKGVCLNEPALQPDECPDLFVGNGADHETFNETKGKCTSLSLFQEARTKKPVREFNINIRARDFGAYGFLQSEASLKNKKPEYESVPVVYADVPHPVRGVINKAYKDNRITIPRDVDENKIADGGWRSLGGVAVADPANNKDDEDNDPAGDRINGDGLAAYEEYRGFRTMTNGFAHVRTNTTRKDLFVHGPPELSVNLFRQQSGLVVHEISEAQYQSNASRVVNFNRNGQTSLVQQKGLRLIKGGTNGNLLGLTLPTVAPPNWITTVTVYFDKVTTESQRLGINFAQKLLQVTAHELAHGCNVYHHGEGNENNPASFDAVNGLRSGNIDCIMRYDNVRRFTPPEKIGSLFCNSAAGTGANANNQNQGDANTALCRGNCFCQFHIKGYGDYYQRVTQNDCRKIPACQ